LTCDPAGARCAHCRCCSFFGRPRHGRTAFFMPTWSATGIDLGSDVGLQSAVLGRVRKLRRSTARLSD
jgi:hypothetical protein